MIRIALVEDDPAYRAQFVRFLREYEQAEGEQIQVDEFTDGLEILDENTFRFDIILMDIQMKHLDGMKTARRIREVNREVILLFITNLSQYALQGYQVEAMSYIMKPVNYFAFSQELRRAIRKLRQRTDTYVAIWLKTGMVQVKCGELTYIETQGNNAIYHTREAEYISREPLKNVEERLGDKYFSRCNNCYLVNLAHVEKVENNTVTVAGQELQMSRPRKKQFMQELAAYIGRE